MVESDKEKERRLANFVLETDKDGRGTLSLKLKTTELIEHLPKADTVGYDSYVRTAIDAMENRIKHEFLLTIYGWGNIPRNFIPPKRWNPNVDGWVKKMQEEDMTRFRKE